MHALVILQVDPKFNREQRLFHPNDPEGETKLDDKEFEVTGADLKGLSLKKRKASDGPEMLKTKVYIAYCQARNASNPKSHPDC